MKKYNSIFWGLILIALGIIFCGNSFEIWDISIFFDGWWTLFIIIPSIYGFFKGEWISSTLGTSIGILLLLSVRNYIEWNMVGKIFIAIVLIVIGLSLILGNKKKQVKKNSKGLNTYLGIFSGNDVIEKDKFPGAEVIAVFGGVDLDLTKAKIKNDITIECVTVFGGIDIKLPDNVNVKTSGVPIFGGIENKNVIPCQKEAPTININYVCIFGGIDLK